MFLSLHPVHVVLLDVFGKADVGLALLHFQHLGHLRVGGAEFQFPTHEPLIDVGPVLPRPAVHDLHGQLLELLLIAALHGLRDDFAPVDVLLQREQYLVGVDGLDEVVGNLLSDGLVHDVFLLALGDHDDGHLRGDLLDALQGLQTAETGHHLVEHDEVEGAFAAFLYGVRAVGDCHHLVTFLL